MLHVAPGAGVTTAAGIPGASRQDVLDVKALTQAPVLIFNPSSGQKLGVSTNAGGAEAVQSALSAAGVPFDPRPTERAGHATELARAAVAEGRRLVIAAGGDGTVGEVAQALARTDSVLNQSHGETRSADAVCVTESEHTARRCDERDARALEAR